MPTAGTQTGFSTEAKWTLFRSLGITWSMVKIRHPPSPGVGPVSSLGATSYWSCLVLCICHLTGKTFENSEMFGQYPLQVNGFKDLHECLEAAMNEGEIESLSAENSTRSGQEVSAKAA